jgi:hypothetical protein
LAGVEASEHPAPQEKNLMYVLLNFLLPFALIHHGINSTVLKGIGGIRAGLKYWREARKK